MIRLEAVTHRPFSAVLMEVAEAIGTAGGWIVNHQLFSNVMLMAAFEVPADQVGILATALEERHIAVTGFTIPEGMEGDVQGTLTVTVQNEGPDMRRPVPAFG